MKKQIDSALLLIKEANIQGCITGSCLLGEFSNQDIDVFCYTSKSFSKLYYFMYHNPLFQILDPLEKWKADMYMIKEDQWGTNKFNIITIKFKFNTCIDINIIFKKGYNNIFSVISTFDMDIICKGYDLQSEQYLDLTGESTLTKKVNINKWNNSFHSSELWEVSRVLRQLERCFKYHERGFDTDNIVNHYIKLIDNIDKHESIFDSLQYNERLKNSKEINAVIRNICTTWLSDHKISDDERVLLQKTIKLL